MGGFEFDTFWNANGPLPLVSFAFFLMYEFTLVIVLLNVIIASMEEAWNGFAENADDRHQYVRADIVDELETFLPNFMLDTTDSKKYPAFVHVLRLA